jgi:cytoskeletal protein CcmA (bactofilin family)
MFSNNKEKLESFVGRNSHFTGDIVTKGTLRVDGRHTGNIEADWLILGEKSFVKGNIKVSGVVVGGLVEGNVAAKEVVDIKRKGRVKGNIETTKIIVVDGGIIDGKITMNREGSKVVELPKDKLKEA